MSVHPKFCVPMRSGYYLDDCKNVKRLVYIPEQLLLFRPNNEDGGKSTSKASRALWSQKRTNNKERRGMKNQWAKTLFWLSVLAKFALTVQGRLTVMVRMDSTELFS